VRDARRNADHGDPGTSPLDPRGPMHRHHRLMSDLDAREFLKVQKVAHVGTVDPAEWSNVLPLIYMCGAATTSTCIPGVTAGSSCTNSRSSS
jgi:hypothetical protein